MVANENVIKIKRMLTLLRETLSYEEFFGVCGNVEGKRAVMPFFLSVKHMRRRHAGYTAGKQRTRRPG